MGVAPSQDRRLKPNYENTASKSNNINGRAKQSTTQVVLPYKYEEILKHADSPLDRSSNEKLLEQLHAGVYLDEKKKKYWVDKETNSNCFILFARDLSITWGEDSRFWLWVKESSDNSVDAELVDVCWLEVLGRFDISNLSPDTTYEVLFNVKIKDTNSYGWETPVNFGLTLPDGSKQECKENLMAKPKGQWIDIQVGEFKTNGQSSGEIHISLHEYHGGNWKKGLVIKGVVLRPKASSIMKQQ